MSQAVIDHLEAIEIQKEQCEQIMEATNSAFQTALKAVDEQRPVRQAGQMIVKSVVQQLLFCELPRCDIRLRSGHPIGLTVGVPNSQTARNHPAVVPILMENPVLRLEVRSGSVDVFKQAAADF